jgi:hypothetical protein
MENGNRAGVVAVMILLLCLMGCAAGTVTEEITEPPKDGSASALSVADTTWEGKDSDGDLFVYEFKKGGDLYYRTSTGYWKNGTWRQEGRSIYFETNRGYAQYEGTVEGEKLEGRGRNVKGLRWHWTATRRD